MTPEEIEYVYNSRGIPVEIAVVVDNTGAVLTCGVFGEITPEIAMERARAKTGNKIVAEELIKYKIKSTSSTGGESDGQKT